MKTLTLCLTFVMATSFVHPPARTPKTLVGYDVQLLSTEAVGDNFEWIWTVTNPYPGNGSDGTLQNLSHWSLAFASCVTQQDVVGVACSTDGLIWNDLPAVIAPDPSQTCYSGTVLKFKAGTSGGHTMYYKLIVNKPFNTGLTRAVFRSGRNTGCYIAMVEGIACEEAGTSR